MVSEFNFSSISFYLTDKTYFKHIPALGRLDVQNSAIRQHYYPEVLICDQISMINCDHDVRVGGAGWWWSAASSVTA